jgi:hypothetical protein
MPRPRNGVTATDRFFALVEIGVEEADCWLWCGYRMPFGHGRFRVDGRKVLAHRFSYEIHVGPIPEGLTLDHLCRVPFCVNPAHLEPVPHRVNVLRGVAPAAHNAVKTNCPHGHDYSPENTYIDSLGRRVCRICRTKWQRNYRLNKQSARDGGPGCPGTAAVHHSE